MTSVEGQNHIFLGQLIITDLCVVSLGRFCRAEFLFLVEVSYYSYVEIEYVPTEKYEFCSRRNDLAVKLLSLPPDS